MTTITNDYYDVIVIGTGPAGFACAVRSAQLGLKTACINNRHDANNKDTHLNTGDIGTMALLDSAKKYHSLIHEYAEHGIYAKDIKLDLTIMLQRKDKILAEIGNKMIDLFNSHNIGHIHASARLLNPQQVEIIADDTQIKSVLNAKTIVLATGSEAITLANIAIDNEFIFDAKAALNINEVPSKLAIIGAGVMGLELANIWSRLGSKTVLLEAQDNFLSVLDQQISGAAFSMYQGQGLDLRLGARVISAKKSNKTITIEYQDQEGTHTLKVDKVIVACGSRPNTANLAAPEANLLLDQDGYVYVDNNCRTNLPGVYAVGDLTLLGPMLAHKGIEEGIFVADFIAGINNPINYDILPSVIYTEPEIAWIGQTEQALRAMGEPIKIAVYPLNSNIRALAIDKREGMVKIIAHAYTDQILGIHIIGTQASELIAEAVLAMEFSASSEDLARTIHARPTLSEAVHDAALTLKDRVWHHPQSLTN